MLTSLHSQSGQFFFPFFKWLFSTKHLKPFYLHYHHISFDLFSSAKTFADVVDIDVEHFGPCPFGKYWGGGGGANTC